MVWRRVSGLLLVAILLLDHIIFLLAQILNSIPILIFVIYTILSEPHAKTFDGTKYDFHSECDLVATSSPAFQNGAGLDLHVRTTLNQHGFSYVSGAVLRIGSDFLEIDANMNLHINAVPVLHANLPTVFAGYPLVKDGMWVRVWLNDFEGISFASPVGMMKVLVDAVLPGASGLVGTTGVPGRIGRDGVSILTPEQMGTEWQVGVGAGDHPNMFMAARAPQFPAQCNLPPAANGRRLGEDSARRRMAEEACAKVTNLEEINDCIFDVMQTGDGSVAVDYME